MGDYYNGYMPSFPHVFGFHVFQPIIEIIHRPCIMGPTALRDVVNDDRTICLCSANFLLYVIRPVIQTCEMTVRETDEVAGKRIVFPFVAVLYVHISKLGVIVIDSLWNACYGIREQF